MKSPLQSTCLPIIEAGIIGSVAGLAALLLNTGVNWLDAARLHFSQVAPPVFVLPVFGFLGGLAAGFLVEHFAPEATGSGIPQVMAALDRLLIPLNFRVALVKLLGGIAALGSGIFLGKEGPCVYLGAAVSAPLIRWIPTAKERRRQLIGAGAGAGLTAVFNAPLAGTVYVLEALLKELRPFTVMIVLVACGGSMLVLNSLCPASLRPTIFPLAPGTTFHLQDLPFCLLLGVLAGLAGAIFNAAILGSFQIYRQLIRVRLSLKVALAGLATGSIVAVLPAILHDYTAMKMLILTGTPPWGIVLIALLEYSVLVVLSYGSGSPGGLFAPSLVLGSALGYLVGCAEQVTTGCGSPTLLAFVGMGAFLSASARAPLTGIVISLELGANVALAFPLAIACVIAYATGETIGGGSIYDRLRSRSRIALKRLKVSGERVWQVSDLMRQGFPVLSGMESLEAAVTAVGASVLRGMPVVEAGKFIGVLHQHDVDAFLKSPGSSNARIRDIMTVHPASVSPRDPLEDIVSLFSERRLTWLPVLDGNQLAGVLLGSDVVTELFDHSEPLRAPLTIQAVNSERDRLSPLAFSGIDIVHGFPGSEGLDSAGEKYGDKSPGSQYDKVISDHVQWKITFLDALLAQLPMNAQAISRDDLCRVGQWLHGEGEVKYGSITSFQLAVATHAHLHMEAGKVAAAINEGRYAEAYNMLHVSTPYSEASRDFVSAYTTFAIEVQTQESVLDTWSRVLAEKPMLRNNIDVPTFMKMLRENSRGTK